MVIKILKRNDSKKIITGSEDNTLKVWDISGKLLHTLRGHFAGIRTISISPNNNLIISGSEDYNIRIWNMETGRILKVLQDHEFSIFDLKEEYSFPKSDVGECC